jgi:glycosyltransferase involved in cell wall biosynthesis
MSLGKRADLKSAAAKPPRLYPWNILGSKKNIVGVLRPCYGSSHVVYGLNTTRYAHRTLLTAPLSRLDSKSTFYEFTPLVLDVSTSLVHTWNALPVNKNFVISFELELPRYLGDPTPAQIRRGMEILSSHRCKAILALSEFALNHAMREFAERGYSALTEKMSVFRGAIRDPMERINAGSRSLARPTFRQRPLSGIVIGTQLFRKGGMFAIQAFERLRASGLNVQLTLVGDFETDCYVFGEHLPDAREWRARARQHDWLRFIGPIPNTQVFAELQSHDICLYPSLDESLGWLPIEAAMLGMPVLGNRVCAFPEFISHMKTGWLIDLPLGHHGRWKGIGANAHERRELLKSATNHIVQGIEDCVRYVYEKPEVLAEWGQAGRKLMMQMYSMDAASLKLELLYDKLMGTN